MIKYTKLFIMGGIFFSLSVLQATEIKEIKLLEDISNELLGNVNKNNQSIKKNKLNKLKKEVSKLNIEQEKSSDFKSTDNTEYNINSIVEIFEKNMVEGIAYKKGESSPFNGIFGAVINDNIDYIESYKNGLLDGESAWFSPNGVKLLSENYSKGKLNGEQKSYYENGQLKSIVFYKNARIDGIISYDINGKILHKSIYKNGTGVWKSYWSNGILAEEGQYVSWKKNGIWKNYRENGNLDITRIYNNGRLVKERWE